MRCDTAEQDCLKFINNYLITCKNGEKKVFNTTYHSTCLLHFLIMFSRLPQNKIVLQSNRNYHHHDIAMKMMVMMKAMLKTATKLKIRMKALYKIAFYTYVTYTDHISYKYVITMYWLCRQVVKALKSESKGPL